MIGSADAVHESRGGDADEPRRAEILLELRTVPGVGKTIALDLWALGVRSLRDLHGADPERLYADLCRLQAAEVDRCMLYVFRCAVYFASTPEPDPELLQWWRWKDAPQAGSGT